MWCDRCDRCDGTRNWPRLVSKLCESYGHNSIPPQGPRPKVLRYATGGTVAKGMGIFQK